MLLILHIPNGTSITQIKFILLQNRQGKTRLSRWYITYSDKEKQKIEKEINRLIITRDSRFTNVIEYLNYKIVYRRYAGLYFAICVDLDENEFMALEVLALSDYPLVR